MFPSKESVRAVVAFDRLPMTPEKKEIGRRYTSDAIGAVEFVGLAKAYVDKQLLTAQGGGEE